MSKVTKIQWCHSTVNPVMGCHGCELWPTLQKILSALFALIRVKLGTGKNDAKTAVRSVLETYEHATGVYHDHFDISLELASQVPTIPSHQWLETIDNLFKCYAGILHMARGAKGPDFDEPVNKGHAAVFDSPQRFPGRMKLAAKMKDPRELSETQDQWLSSLPRLIFVSDMGDALSDSISFAYLKEEIIDVVSSPNGRRHIWLWLTKRPRRMADFATWLRETHDVSWPDNLVSMTSVTGRATRNRVKEIREVPARVRGLSVEPLSESVDLDLDGIEWVIVGGESGSHSRPFDLSWARDIQEQCKRAGVAFFMKQLGANITDDGFPLSVVDSHGGDWEEWPTDLRVREFPRPFYDDSLVARPDAATGEKLEASHTA